MIGCAERILGTPTKQKNGLWAYSTIQGNNSVSVEDTKAVRYVSTYEDMAKLTDGSTEKLTALLKDLGFDFSSRANKIIKYDHKEDRQIELVQEQEW